MITLIKRIVTGSYPKLCRECVEWKRGCLGMGAVDNCTGFRRPWYSPTRAAEYLSVLIRNMRIADKKPKVKPKVEPKVETEVNREYSQVFLYKPTRETKGMNGGRL